MFFYKFSRKLSFQFINSFNFAQNMEMDTTNFVQIEKEDVAGLHFPKEEVLIKPNISGIIEEVYVEAGDDVKAGDLIAEILNQNLETKIKEQIIVENLAQDNNPYQNIKSASPKIRKFARELGVNIQLVEGSARKGRILEEDIKQFIKSTLNNKINKEETIQKIEIKEEKLPYEHGEFGEIDVQKIPRIKRLSGPHLVKAWNEIPHVTQFDEIDVTDMEHFRKNLIDLNTKEKITITPLAFIMKALVNGMKKYPNFNCSLEPTGENIIYKKYSHYDNIIKQKCIHYNSYITNEPILQLLYKYVIVCRLQLQFS